MSSSRNSKQCKTTSLTGLVSDMILKIMREDKYNPVIRPERWFLKVLAFRVKVDNLRIRGLKDSHLEICQYKSHGAQTHTQVGIKVTIPTVTAEVNIQ